MRLLLPLGAEARQVRLRLSAFESGQAVTLIVDGRRIGAQPVTQAERWVTFDLPADAVQPQLSDVRLQFARLIPIAEIVRRVPASAPGLPAELSLVVRSAGQETGDFAHIYVNGVDRSPNRRGYNLVALDGRDGRLLGAAAFDTHGDPAASHQLALWVQALPAGTVVAGGARDDASMALTPEAGAALRSLGAAVDLRGRFRWGHAFIGRTGSSAPVGEHADGLRVAQVGVGWPATAPRIAASLTEIEIVR